MFSRKSQVRITPPLGRKNHPLAWSSFRLNVTRVDQELASRGYRRPSRVTDPEHDFCDGSSRVPTPKPTATPAPVQHWTRPGDTAKADSGIRGSAQRPVREMNRPASFTRSSWRVARRPNRASMTFQPGLERPCALRPSDRHRGAGTNKDLADGQHGHPFPRCGPLWGPPVPVMARQSQVKRHPEDRAAMRILGSGGPGVKRSRPAEREQLGATDRN